jgi:gluconolactonase
MTKFREIASGLGFPEGPIVFDDGSLIVSDVAGSRLLRIAPGGSVSVAAKIDGAPAGAALGPGGYCYFCNAGTPDFHERDGRILPHFAEDEPPRGSIQRADLSTGKIETLYTECDGEPLRGPNDLALDATGGIWFTDHGKVRKQNRDHGALYYCKSDGSYIKRMVFPLLGPNGVGLSPSGTRVYIAETPSARIWAFELSAPGVIEKSGSAELGKKGKLLVGLGGYQWLDSLAVDGEGWVCVATLIKGGITAVSPDGKNVEFHPLPDEFTTNICFGGKENRTAYVTLSSTSRLVAFDWPRPGLRLNFAG